MMIAEMERIWLSFIFCCLALRASCQVSSSVVSRTKDGFVAVVRLVVVVIWEKVVD